MLPEYKVCCSAFSKYGLDLQRSVFEKLDCYAEFLVEYNEKVNLTAITEPSEILIKHFIDSILLSKHVDIPEKSRIIDVGTGAGFPSVPLKIYRPDINITLLDSLNKRIVFLEQLCDKLVIDADFIHGRAEDFSKLPEYREKFDFSCARAVANLPVLCELCLPYVKTGGVFIAMKTDGSELDGAKNAIAKPSEVTQSQYTSMP